MSEERVVRIEAKIDHLMARGVLGDTNVHRLTGRVDGLNANIEKLIAHVDGLSRRVDEIDVKVDGLQEQIDRLRDHLERIAAGVAATGA